MKINNINLNPAKKVIFLLTLGLISPVFSNPVNLLEGDNLDQWVANTWQKRELVPVKEGDFDFWTISEGVLRARYSPELTGSYLVTKKEYENFVISLDFRFQSEDVDSGIMIRGMSDQIQIGISGSLKRDLTAAPYIEKKGYPVEATEAMKTLKTDDWNTLKVEVRGNVYKTWLNGVEGVTYASDTATDKGPLALQLHPNRKTSIDFRNIQIEELPSKSDSEKN